MPGLYVWLIQLVAPFTLGQTQLPWGVGSFPGTTMGRPLASMPVAHIGHLGDSRAYLYRAGQLQQLTRDHTLVEKLVQRGLIDATTALTHPERHILTRGLGMGVDMKPELTSTPITPQDLIVLCSDGLTKMLEDAAIASVLSRARGDPNQACHDLIEQALNRGGEDNVTVIVVASMTSAVAKA